MERINKPISLSTEEVINALSAARDDALDKGKMNKSQMLNLLIGKINDDETIAPKMFRIALKRFCRNTNNPIADEVKATWEPEFDDVVENYRTNGTFQKQNDRRANNLLTYDQALRLIAGYRNSAISRNIFVRLSLFDNADKYLRENPKDIDLILNFIHYVIGQKSGIQIPYLYRARSWDDEYYAKLVDLRKVIFNGSRI